MTTKTLITQTTVLTLDDEDRMLTGADVALSGDRIVAVGTPPPDFEPDTTIDGRGLLALPAFFNAHTHAAMTLERGWAEDLPFEQWLNDKIRVAESALEEDVAWGAALAVMEMVRGGIVGFADHYFWMDQVARVVESNGGRGLRGPPWRCGLGMVRWAVALPQRGISDARR